jgi:hypothetical protein
MALRPYPLTPSGGTLGVTGVSPVGRSPKEDIMSIRFHRTSLVAGVKGKEAAAFAAEVSTYLTESMGIPTTWGMEVGGTYGTMHWFAEYTDMAAFEVGLVKTITDPGYIAILAKAEDLFVEGTTEDTIIYLM